jgi:hypothetical protein
VAKKAETEKDVQTKEKQQDESAVKSIPQTVISEPYFDGGELKYKETVIK